MRNVNDTGFKLVFGRSDWRDRFDVDATAAGADEMPDSDIVYDTTDQWVTLRPLPGQFTRETDEPVLEPSDRSSAGRDQYGSWYWIDPEQPTRVVVRSARDKQTTTFWPAPSHTEGSSEAGDTGTFRPAGETSPCEPQFLGALAITIDHRLVVAARSPDQLLVFDLYAGGPPQRIRWHGDGLFAPVDASPRPDGGVMLLEKPADANARVWSLDHTLRPGTAGKQRTSGLDFRPADAKSEAGDASRSSLSPAGPVELPAALDPHAIEVLPDDTFLILSRSTDATADKPAVYRYGPVDAAQTEENLGSIDLSAVLAQEGFTEDGEDGDSQEDWQAHDMVFIPEPAGVTEVFHGTLYVVGREGNQGYAVHLTGGAREMTADLQPKYLPLRRFTGKALAAAGDTVYYDSDDRWLPVRARGNPRFVEEGQIVSKPFDSETVGCTWHRIFIDGCIPPGASVRIETRASDHIDRLDDHPWQPQPDLYRRDMGAEIPYYDPFPNSASESGGKGTWELLLQRTEGRYLRLRMTLEGNRQASPRLRAVRVYGPRFSYLEEYMPDLYQEDETSARFMERFLANAEGMLTEMEGKIAAAETLFDVRTVPDEYLDWLATWFGTTLDPALDTRRKRLFLEHAVELFRQRGTLEGLARMLMLVLDPCADEFLFTPAGVADAVGRPGDVTDRTVRQSSVRIVEEFAARDVPRAVVGGARTPQQPAQVRVDRPWTFTDGADTLHRRFRSFLDHERYDSAAERRNVWGDEPSFPPYLPSPEVPQSERKRSDWRVFVRRIIDGPYAAIESERTDETSAGTASSVTKRFRAYLQRRYRSRDELPAAWIQGVDSFTAGTSLQEVKLPPELPTGQALKDWMEFVGTVLPVRRAAHRFRVLVPVDPDANPQHQQQRLDVARRVVEHGKPAHTAFEVLPYSAAFRVGTVRVGLDTVLGRGSRYASLIVGDGLLGEEILGADPPGNVVDRRVIGRDAVDEPRPL